MKEYPKLTEMGVMHPEQIKNFVVNSISSYDVLRINYGRQKGSILPVSRYYKFLRVPNTVPAKGGKKETVLETHPCLRSALEELRELLKTKEKKENLTDAILEEVRLLEEDIAMRSECIKRLANKI